MKVSYDKEVDGIFIRFGDEGSYDGSEEVQPGVLLDFDTEGRVIAIDILDARKVVPSEDLETFIAAALTGPGTAEFDRAIGLARTFAKRVEKAERRLAI